MVFCFFIIYYRSVYSTLFVFVFCFEYFYFINYVINIYGSSDTYYKIDVKAVDLSEIKISDIWLEYCKLLAFQKLYMMLLKNKKINPRNVMIILVVWFFSIPLKFLMLCKYFLLSKSGLKKSMLKLYFSLFLKLKNFKIEVLDGEVYLNCLTPGKLCVQILKSNPQITKQNFILGIKELQKKSHEFSKYEEGCCEVKLIAASDNNGDEVFSFHYGIVEGKSTLHSTSSTPKTLLHNQKLEIAIPGLILLQAKKPGTIITEGVDKILISNKTKLLPKIELESIKYQHLDLFTQHRDTYKYIQDKDQIYKNIMQEYFYHGAKVDQTLIKEFRINVYNPTLKYCREEDFIEGYINFYKNFKE